MDLDLEVSSMCPSFNMMGEAQSGRGLPFEWRYVKIKGWKNDDSNFKSHRHLIPVRNTCKL